MIRKPDTIAAELANATDCLTDQICKLHGEEMKAADAERELTNKRHTILLTTDPKTLGSNEATREAAIAFQSAAEVAKHSTCVAMRDAVKYAVELARIRLSAARDQLRCAELAAGVERTR